MDRSWSIMIDHHDRSWWSVIIDNEQWWSMMINDFQTCRTGLKSRGSSLQVCSLKSRGSSLFSWSWRRLWLALVSERKWCMINDKWWWSIFLEMMYDKWYMMINIFPMRNIFEMTYDKWSMIHNDQWILNFQVFESSSLQVFESSSLIIMVSERTALEIEGHYFRGPCR